MKVYLTRTYEIECGHRLNGMRDGHKCARQHGHNYTIEITLSRDEEQLDNGMVLDAENIDISIKPVLKRLDHFNLNDLGGDDPDRRRGFAPLNDQPTAENIARYLWRALQFMGNCGQARMDSVKVFENRHLAAEVRA